MNIRNRLAGLFRRPWTRLAVFLGLTAAVGAWVAAQTTPWLTVSADPYKIGLNGSRTSVSALVAGTDYRGSTTALTTTPASNTEIEYVIGVSSGSFSDTQLRSLGQAELSLSLPDGLSLLQVTGKPPSWTAAGSSGSTLKFMADSLSLMPSSAWAPGLGDAFGTASGGGDGYTPIIYRSAVNGRRKVFTIHHRTLDIPGASSNINCIDISGARCSGYPKLMSNAGSTLGVSWAPKFVVKGERIFFPAMVSGSSVGVGCWNAEYDRLCALTDTVPTPPYMQVSSFWNPGYKTAALGGVVEIPAQPNRLFVTYWGKLHCIDLATQQQCGNGTPMTFEVAEADPAAGANRYTFGTGDPTTGSTDILVAGTAEQPDSMVFTVINGYLSCWDLRTWPGSRCNAGNQPFSSRVHVPLSDFYDYKAQISLLSHYLDRSGNTIGACLSVGSAWYMYNSRTRCYDTHGDLLPLPSLLAGKPETARNVTTDQTRNFYNVHHSAKIGTRVYYALPAKFKDDTGGIIGTSNLFSDLPGFAAEGTTACWDFAGGAEGSGGAPCPLFYDSGANAIVGARRWNQNNAHGYTGGVIVPSGSSDFPGRTADYGYTVDPANPECLYGLGDTGRIWSFSATTGVSPCPSAASIDQVVKDPAPFCQTGAAQPNWSALVLNNLPTSTRSATITLYDLATCPLNSPVTSCPASAVVGTATKSWASAADISARESITLSPSSAGSLKMTGASLRLRVQFGYLGNTVPLDWSTFSYELKNDAPAGKIGEICVRARVSNCPAPRLNTVAAFRASGDGRVVGQGLSVLTTGTVLEELSDVPPAVNSTTVKSNRVLYRATYRVSDWSGDLTAFSTANGSPQATPVWTTASGLGNASALLPAAANRLILSSRSDAGATVGFTFDSATVNGSGMQTVQPSLGATADERTRLVDYIRGDRSNEVGIGSTSNSTVVYRRRMAWTDDTSITPLGAIVRSEPVFSNGMVYVQANDGMLHAFDASTGVEKFAYIPSALLPRLKSLSDPGYVYTPLMEGQVAVTDFVLNPLEVAASPIRVLIGSTGGVAPSLYAIKVGGLPATPPAASDVLWETTHADLGQANGRMAFVTLGDVPYALLGNGPGSASGRAKLIVVNLRTGAITSVDTGSVAANGLSAPTVLYSSVTGAPLAVYAGDLNGTLWRFPLNASGVFGTPVAIFKDPSRPITAAPVVSIFSALSGSSTPNGYMVMFGTGQPIDRTGVSYDAAAASEQTVQRIYGILETASSASAVPQSAATVAIADLQAQSWTGDTLSADTLPSGKKGWYFPLKEGSVADKVGAERLVTSLAYDASTQSITAVTTVPRNVDCPTPALASSTALVASALNGGQSTQLRFVGDTAVSRVTIDGTLGGFVRTDSGTTVNTNYTSNARAGTAAIAHAGRLSTGTVTAFSLSASATTVRRTSWIQLY